MKFTEMSLHVIEMTLKNPFTTSLGTVKERSGIIVVLSGEKGQEGYGEAVAFSTPWYTAETVETCLHMLRDVIAPLLIGKTVEHPSEVANLLSVIRGNQMAKAAVDMAAWDLYAKEQNKPLTEVIGGTRTTALAGVVIGAATIDELLRQTAAYVEKGYTRVKLKIKPGRDLEWIQAIRERFPELSILADANSAYTGHLEDLYRLDRLGLQMIEQPLRQDDFTEHAALQKRMSTPICLDESIESFYDAKSAIELGSAKVINVKIGRVGGVTEAIRIHDLCQEQGIQVWCGGMLEFGVSRAFNVALSTLPGFSIPGDLSSSDRYWHKDITVPDVVVERGEIVPFTGPGIGVVLNRKRLDEVTLKTIVCT